MFFVLISSVGHCVNEDLTTYTEVDEGTDLTITSAKVDISTIQMNRLSYVRRDMGSACIGDFDIDFTCNMATDVSGSSLGCFAVSDDTNNSRTSMDANNVGLIFGYNRWFVAGNWRMRDEENSAQDSVVAGTPSQTRYLTISRTGTTFQTLVYTDADRTTLEDTLSLTSGTDTYQYVYAFYNHNDDVQFPTNTFSGYTENFELNGLCAVATASVHQVIIY